MKKTFVYQKNPEMQKKHMNANTWGKTMIKVQIYFLFIF